MNPNHDNDPPEDSMARHMQQRVRLARRLFLISIFGTLCIAVSARLNAPDVFTISSTTILHGIAFIIGATCCYASGLQYSCARRDAEPYVRLAELVRLREQQEGKQQQ